MENYTEEQIKDIKERVGKATEFIKSLELEFKAQVGAVNLGDDTFALKVQPFLKDTKYEPIATPTEPTEPITTTPIEPTVSPFVPQPPTE